MQESKKRDVQGLFTLVPVAEFTDSHVIYRLNGKCCTCIN